MAKKISYLFLILVFVSCKSKNTEPSKESIAGLNLKRGALISCGAAENQFGSVVFENSCSEKVKEDFSLAIELLHSFEYEEAEKVFAKIIDKEPGCAMAYWGVAMSNYHPLWTPPTEAELIKGAKAIEIARSIREKSERENEYIMALSSFFEDWQNVDHQTRAERFEKGMEKLYADYPADNEAAIFYALSLDAAADPADLSYKNQKKAGAILTALYKSQPNHPGIAHYIIHTYDYPELADSALSVANKYASIAPSSAHAQHMPSHIFTRLGLWDACINSNLASVASAKCYAETAGFNAHWDEELHGLDYLEYAYLQKGEDSLAKAQWDYLDTISKVYPVNFKVAYAFAAIPSRYLLENRKWEQAASLKIAPAFIPWKKFPWQEAIFHFTRALGDAHLKNTAAAKYELEQLNTIHDTLLAQKDSYKAKEVQIQILSSEAWIDFTEGHKKTALEKMKMAADLEDKTAKHPVTPCEVIPARELLADMELQMNDKLSALSDYKTDLSKHRNRLNGMKGVSLASK